MRLLKLFFLSFFFFSVFSVNKGWMASPQVNLTLYSPGSLDASYSATSVPVEALKAANTFLEALNQRDLNALKAVCLNETVFNGVKKGMERCEKMRPVGDTTPFAVFQALIVSQEEANTFWLQFAFQGTNRVEFVRDVYVLKIVNHEGVWKISTRKA